MLKGKHRAEIHVCVYTHFSQSIVEMLCQAACAGEKDEYIYVCKRAPCESFDAKQIKCVFRSESLSIEAQFEARFEWDHSKSLIHPKRKIIVIILRVLIEPTQLVF